MKRLFFIFFSVVLVAPLSAEVSDAEIEKIYFGIYQDGSCFFDWSGDFEYRISRNGNLNLPNGINASLDLIRSDITKIKVHLEKVYIDDDGIFKIKGTIKNDTQSKLIILGTGENFEDFYKVYSDKGSVVINYEGAIPFVYEKPNQE